MENNDTSVTDYNISELLIPLCRKQGEKVAEAGYVVAAVNVAAIIINALHIFLLSKMVSLKETAYYHILVHLSAGDILFSISFVCYMLLNELEYFVNWPIVALVAYEAALETFTYGRYGIMGIAALERYYALCHPMTYKSSRIMKNIRVWLAFVWVTFTATNLITAGISYRDFCFFNVSGPNIINGVKSIFNFAGLGLLSVIIVALLVRVIVELVRMRNHQVSQEDQLVKRNVQYVIIIIAIYYFLFLAPIFGYLVRSSVGEDIPLVFYLGEVMIPSLYGIGNVIIYGWLIAAYRKTAWEMLLCRRRTIRRPDPDMTSNI